jgi:sugar O-acyltransferase (sialic acid O-acetyltransferase NeuD family)
MKDIVLIGGGGHCEAVIDVIEQENKFKIIGIIDKPELLGKNIQGYEIIGNDSELKEVAKFCDNAFITIGHIKSSMARVELFKTAVELGFNLPTIISPRAYISKHANIGIGTVIMHDVLINTKVSIGDNCIINTKSLIEHGSEVGNHCHISTNAVINGNVLIGNSCFIGSASVTKQCMEIKDNSFVKAGSVFK